MRANERTSERSGGRERSEQSGASEGVSGASERANGRASGPVLTSLFLFVPDHSAVVHTMESKKGVALWSGTNKNRDLSTGPLARPFARSLPPLTRSLAPDCSLRSRPLLRSLDCSLAHFAHSLPGGKVID